MYSSMSFDEEDESNSDGFFFHHHNSFYSDDEESEDSFHSDNEDDENGEDENENENDDGFFHTPISLRGMDLFSLFDGIPDLSYFRIRHNRNEDGKEANPVFDGNNEETDTNVSKNMFVFALGVFDG